MFFIRLVEVDDGLVECSLDVNYKHIGWIRIRLVCEVRILETDGFIVSECVHK